MGQILWSSTTNDNVNYVFLVLSFLNGRGVALFHTRLLIYCFKLLIYAIQGRLVIVLLYVSANVKEKMSSSQMLAYVLFVNVTFIVALVM